MSIKPFRIAVQQGVLDDLKDRLARVRWPDEAPSSAWLYGASLGYMQDFVAYWRDSFDWRTHEADLNTLPQFTTEIDGIDVHFIHVEGKGPNPKPLLLSHGWPGSIVEFRRIIPMLTDPARFGGDPKDSFTIVAPSLPGYGFSFRPGQKRVGLAGIAAIFHTLMTQRLGYAKFAAQGGDWGAFITSCLGANYADDIYGIHVNLLAVPRDANVTAEPTPEEKAYFKALNEFLTEGTGYQWIQGTRPQTLAYGLTDSPAGLAAWIVEKFRAWSDCGGDVETAISKDDMLTNITIYWATGAINSSFWPYYDRRHGPWPFKLGEKIKAPMGYAEFPHEIISPPRSIAERLYDVRRWTRMPKGGHFAALEQPELLAEEIRAFFRGMK